MSSVHLVSVISAFIGHIRPALGFITALVDKHPEVTYTIFCFLPRVATVHEEIRDANISPEARTQIRVVGVSTIDPGYGPEAIPVGLEEITKHVPEAYKVLADGGQVTCTATGTTFDYAGILPPKVVLIDAILPYLAQPLKDIAPKASLLAFWISTAGVFGHFGGPEKWAGHYNWIKETEEAVKANPDKPYDDIANGIMCNYSGVVKTNAEGVSFYDYELYPQEQPPDGMTCLNMATAKFPTEPYIDGIVLASTETLEPKTTELVLRQWYEGELGKKAYHVGPGAAHLFKASLTTAIEPKFQPVFDFLDSKPARSVWLVSFGTLYYPFLHPNHVTTVLTTLMKNNTPFILSRAAILSALAPLPADFETKVKESGLGMIVDFLPQQESLRHPSVGAFVTHGGVNSTFEIVVCGKANVTPIFWPMSADQPMVSMAMVKSRDCAIELVQVRTGRGARPVYNGGAVQGTDEAVAAEIEQVLADIKGEAGDRKRRNLKVVHDELAEAVKDGGAIEKTLADLVKIARRD